MSAGPLTAAVIQEKASIPYQLIRELSLDKIVYLSPFEMSTMVVNPGNDPLKHNNNNSPLLKFLHAYFSEKAIRDGLADGISVMKKSAPGNATERCDGVFLRDFITYNGVKPRFRLWHDDFRAVRLYSGPIELIRRRDGVWNIDGEYTNVELPAPGYVIRAGQDWFHPETGGYLRTTRKKEDAIKDMADYIQETVPGISRVQAEELAKRDLMSLPVWRDNDKNAVSFISLTRVKGTQTMDSYTLNLNSSVPNSSDQTCGMMPVREARLPKVAQS